MMQPMATSASISVSEPQTRSVETERNRRSLGSHGDAPFGALPEPVPGKVPLGIRPGASAINRRTLRRGFIAAWRAASRRTTGQVGIGGLLMYSSKPATRVGGVFIAPPSATSIMLAPQVKGRICRTLRVPSDRACRVEDDLRRNASASRNADSPA